MLQKIVMDGPCLAAGPFLAKYLKFEGIDEFRFAQGRQKKCGLILG